MTDRGPVKPGNVNSNAINIKPIAAPIVILAKTFNVPRGPKAALLTVLVNSAPASALPGCNKTAAINITQARTNKIVKMIDNKTTNLLNQRL
jgi:hypothetical protein